MADRNDIRIQNNAAWAGIATITDEDDEPRDLTSAAFKTEIRTAADSAAVLATLSTTNGRHTLSATPTDGRLYYSIPLAVAAALDPGRYVYDTLMTPSGGAPELVTFGSILVIDGVTES